MRSVRKQFWVIVRRVLRASFSPFMTEKTAAMIAYANCLRYPVTSSFTSLSYYVSLYIVCSMIRLDVRFKTIYIKFHIVKILFLIFFFL